MQIAIRPVRKEDFPAWLKLWDGYNSFYGRSGETALASAVTSMTWSRFFDAYEPVHALVAEQDGALLGLVHFLYHRSTTAIGLSCYLQDLFTVEDARGLGVGRALIEIGYRIATSFHQRGHQVIGFCDRPPGGIDKTRLYQLPLF